MKEIWISNINNLRAKGPSKKHLIRTYLKLEKKTGVFGNSGF